MKEVNYDKMISESTCFGVAYDEHVKECRLCEVCRKCQMAMNGEPYDDAPIVNVEEEDEEKEICVDEKDEVLEAIEADQEETKEEDKKPENIPIAEVNEISTTDEAMDKSQAKDEDPKTKRVDKKATKKPAKKYAADMPVFKEMSLEEVEALLVEKGGNPSDFDKYRSNNVILKMRLTMWLKKLYEVKE